MQRFLAVIQILGKRLQHPRAVMECHRTQCRPASCNCMLAHGDNIQRRTPGMPDQRPGKSIMQRGRISARAYPGTSCK